MTARLKVIEGGRGCFHAHNPAMRGYHAVYRRDHINYCPGCGRSHWWLGRIGAECAFCALALRYSEAGNG